MGMRGIRVRFLFFRSRGEMSRTTRTAVPRPVNTSDFEYLTRTGAYRPYQEKESWFSFLPEPG
jgi:hypothetical protein